MTAQHNQKLLDARDWCRQELDKSIAFWLEHGLDREHGGVYTCLDRIGEVYSTDKSVWMQGRCAWMFSYLCHLYGKRPEWMEAAKSCLDFLENYCINQEAGGRLYFTVTAEGKPLRQRRYCFSEGFYAIANAEYYGLTGEAEAPASVRAWAYHMIYDLNNGLIDDPTGLGPKTLPETRSGHALGDPMIFLNIISIMRRVDPASIRRNTIATHASAPIAIVNDALPSGAGLHAGECAAATATPELWYTAGRVVNPGHDIECSWFMMDEANYRGDAQLHANG